MTTIWVFSVLFLKNISRKAGGARHQDSTLIFSEPQSVEFQEVWGGTNTGLVHAYRQDATAGLLVSGMLKDNAVFEYKEAQRGRLGLERRQIS